LFYPKSLPPHLEVDTKTIQVSDVAVIMQVRDATGKKAAITEQARPANFDFESLTAGKRFTTPSGDAIINTNGTITTASLDTPWTWILLRSDPGFPSQSAEALINALEPL
jgi:hypothetical protein